MVFTHRDFRDNVLARLLELDQNRLEEEVLLGTGEKVNKRKASGKGTKGVKSRKENRESGRELF